MHKPSSPNSCQVSSYGVTLPERLSTNYERYRKRGGLLDVDEDTNCYATFGKLPDPNRFVFLSLAFDQIHKEEVAGDIVELGVYRGQTATILASNARRLDRTVWLLDTFEGFALQDFAGIDAGINTGRGPKFADTSLDHVRARIGTANTRYIQGFFPESAEQLPQHGRYCMVHIDCDLYAPIRSALNYFYPRVAPGGYVVVHDYGSLSWDGVEKAVDEFFADKPECVIQMPDRAGSVVIRKQRENQQATTWLQRKQMVPTNEWLEAGNNKLAALLDNGWSQPELWGIWGVGASHAISLLPADAGQVRFDVEFDVHAVVLPTRPALDVDVLLNGTLVTTWRFTVKQNRGLRSVMVSGQAGDIVTIELRPHAMQSPHEIDPSQGETRQLGVFLHRLRVNVHSDH
jgi:hypothetical protein